MIRLVWWENMLVFIEILSGIYQLQMDPMKLGPGRKSPGGYFSDNDGLTIMAD